MKWSNQEQNRLFHGGGNLPDNVLYKVCKSHQLGIRSGQPLIKLLKELEGEYAEFFDENANVFKQEDSEDYGDQNRSRW